MNCTSNIHTYMKIIFYAGCTEKKKHLVYLVLPSNNLMILINLVFSKSSFVLAFGESS